MKYVILFSLLLYSNTIFAKQNKSNNAFKDVVDISVGAKAEALSTVGNIIIALLNSCDDDKRDCEEAEEDDIPYIEMMFGGETKMGVNLDPFLLSGGYDLLSFPKEFYGDEIVTSTFFIESQINFINDDVQTPYVFGQIGRSSFSVKEIMNHWRYTMGVGYEGGDVGIDFGYSFFNKPEEQTQEFFLTEDDVFRVKDSFLQSGFLALRLRLKLL